jgi:1-deoxy-D-xylulose-5-phosphate reductoisomerase
VLQGGTAPAVFNAANETAVAAFLASEIMFTGIVEHIEHVLQAHLEGKSLEGKSLEGKSLEGKSDFGPGSGFISGNALTLEDVLAADSWARGIVPGN